MESDDRLGEPARARPTAAERRPDPRRPPHRRRTAPALTIWLAVLCFAAILALLPASAEASALTTTIAANEKLCFYAAVDKPLEKVRPQGPHTPVTSADEMGPQVGFYFAVQSGGSFDIDWVVTDPIDTIIIEGERDHQGDYIFTATQVGEYSFCFNNGMSSFSEKLIDFDIMVESEPRPSAPAKPTSMVEQTSSLEESIYKLSGSLSSIQRTQKYFRYAPDLLCRRRRRADARDAQDAGEPQRVDRQEHAMATGAQSPKVSEAISLTTILCSYCSASDRAPSLSACRSCRSSSFANCQSGSLHLTDRVDRELAGSFDKRGKYVRV